MVQWEYVCFLACSNEVLFDLAQQEKVISQEYLFHDLIWLYAVHKLLVFCDCGDVLCDIFDLYEEYF